MTRTLYTFLFSLALPLILLRIWLRGRKLPAYRQRMSERLAMKLPSLQPDGIWVHAVSVGESVAAAPMVRALLEQYPDLPVTITCMTPTGSERIRALFGERVQHCYLPWDLPWAVRRFLDVLRPRLGVIMETELWPNYIHQCHQRGIPVILANARLSARSARGYGRLSSLTAPMLDQLDGIAVQTEVEAQRFVALGAREESICVTGSIKFDLVVEPELLARAHELREVWGAALRPVWIAASTHAGEEQIILQAHRQLLRVRPDALLLLVPRHPDRFEAVNELCSQEGFACVRRSSGWMPSGNDQVMLGDSMGELLFLYALADVAFVGGSLVASGGHNLLEPAALRLPVISGPHLFNFQDIAALLDDAGALRKVMDASTLAAEVQLLLEDKALRDELGASARRVVQQNQGALARLLLLLEQRLSTQERLE